MSRLLGTILGLGIGALSRYQFVQDHAERIDITRGSYGFAPDLLRTSVLWRQEPKYSERSFRLAEPAVQIQDFR